MGEEGLKLETYESICWEKNAWFPIIMFPWRNPSNYRTPFPNNWLFLQLRFQNPGPEELNGIQIFRCGTWLLHFRFRYGSKFIAWQEPRFFFPFLLVRLEPSSRFTVTSWKVAPEATHFSIKFRHSINMNFWFCSLRGLQKKITYHIVSQANDSRRKNIIQIFWTGWGFPWTVINTSATNTALRQKAARLRISSRDLTESAEKITFLGCWVWWGFSQHKQGFFTNQHRWLTRKNGDLSRKNGDLTRKNGDDHYFGATLWCFINWTCQTLFWDGCETCSKRRGGKE